MRKIKLLLANTLSVLFRIALPWYLRQRLMQLLLRSEIAPNPQESLRHLLAWHDETLTKQGEQYPSSAAPAPGHQ